MPPLWQQLSNYTGMNVIISESLSLINSLDKSIYLFILVFILQSPYFRLCVIFLNLINACPDLQAQSKHVDLHSDMMIIFRYFIRLLNKDVKCA